MTKHCEDVDYQIMHALGGSDIDAGNIMDVFDEGKVIFSVDRKLRIIMDEENSSKAGAIAAKTIFGEYPIVLDEMFDTILYVGGRTPYHPSKDIKRIEFRADRTIRGIHPEDKEKASVFWNAFMDELEKMQGEGK